MSEHKWGEVGRDSIGNKILGCGNEGCTVRKIENCSTFWQRAKRAHWHNEERRPLPPCTGTDALKPTALGWYGDGKLLYLAKRIVVAGITDSDKPCYWLAGGSDDETSKPYESIADCMQDAEAEVRRLLREAGVVLP